MALAVVTGAGVRVGQAIATALAAVGHDVVCCVNRSKGGVEETVKQIEARGQKAWIETADLSRADDVDALGERIRDAHPVVDVLVHNAGVFGEVPFAQIDRQRWRAMLAVNLEAPFFITQKVLPSLERAADPVVVHVTDIAADRPMNRHAHYNVTKAGLAMLTKTLAVELGPKVRVCSVAPGTVAFPPDYDEEKQQRILARVPLKRAGAPEDVALAVAFIVRAPYLSGVTIPVDGGRGVVL